MPLSSHPKYPRWHHNNGSTLGGQYNYAFPNAALIRVGAQYKVTEQMSFFADVNSLLATQGVTLGGQIGMQVKW